MLYDVYYIVYGIYCVIHVWRHTLYIYIYVCVCTILYHIVYKGERERYPKIYRNKVIHHYSSFFVWVGFDVSDRLGLRQGAKVRMPTSSTDDFENTTRVSAASQRSMDPQEKMEEFTTKTGDFIWIYPWKSWDSIISIGIILLKLQLFSPIFLKNVCEYYGILWRFFWGFNHQGGGTLYQFHKPQVDSCAQVRICSEYVGSLKSPELTQNPAKRSRKSASHSAKINQKKSHPTSTTYFPWSAKYLPNINQWYVSWLNSPLKSPRKKIHGLDDLKPSHAQPDEPPWRRKNGRDDATVDQCYGIAVYDILLLY